MTPSARYAAALARLGRSAASLAPLLRCSARTCQQWADDAAPPPDVLAWVEAMAEAVSAIPVPEVRLSRGRPKRALDTAASVGA